jgi:hypothetical protein
MAKKDHPEKPAGTGKGTPPSEEMRQMVQEDIDEQRKLLDKMRRKMN